MSDTHTCRPCLRLWGLRSPPTYPRLSSSPVSVVAVVLPRSVVVVCCPWQSTPAIRFHLWNLLDYTSYWPHPHRCLCRYHVTMGWKIPAKLHRQRSVASSAGVSSPRVLKTSAKLLISAGATSPWVWRPQQNSTPCRPSQPVTSYLHHLYRVQSTFTLRPPPCRHLLSHRRLIHACILRPSPAPLAHQFSSIASPPHCQSVSAVVSPLSHARCRYIHQSSLESIEK